MIDRPSLVRDLKAQVRELEEDFRARATDEFDETLRAEWRAACAAERTAAPYESGLKNSWLDDRVTQAAVAWVLGTVFVRFCEDNGLLEYPYLAGRASKEYGSRLAVAKELQEEYWNTADDPTDRGWIERSFDALAVTKVTAGLFNRTHNPMWTITPSHEAAKGLLAFWRETDENGEIKHDFTDNSWSTRFLGDLYQELSEHARDTYALLQTPDFVEEFILDYTLTPALEEFGLSPEFRLIDPACGSGHFLLGAFNRLLHEWERQAPATDRWELIARALNSVHGVDKNPYAAAVARFRLLIAAMEAGGIYRLKDLRSDFTINVAVGDSLLHGEGGPHSDTEIPGLLKPSIFTYRTEDVLDYVKSCDILAAGSYHAVVGNPPYITVKDKKENKTYRKHYSACSGKYALSVPFAQRFFNLAKRAGGDRRGAGFVGQITSNSFMKREYGKKLIEDFFAQKVELTHVIDASGCQFPGFGVPTVVLFGRSQIARPLGCIRAILGIRGGASEGNNATVASAWQAIVDQIEFPGTESDWVSCVNIPRSELAKFPWSLAGGGATQLTAILETGAVSLRDLGADVGMTAFTGEDEAFVMPERIARRLGLRDECVVLVNGDDVKDYQISPPNVMLLPVEWSGEEKELSSTADRFLWPLRTNLKNRLYFGKTPEERGLRWFDLGIFFPARHITPLSISYAQMGMRNNFSLDRGGKAFKQSAPVVKLGKASESLYLGVLGLLGSSAACFWLKQKCHNYGDKVDSQGSRITGLPYFDTYDFPSTKVADYPAPQSFPTDLGKRIDELAQCLDATNPMTVSAGTRPTRERLDAARVEYERIREMMIGLQEELDWEVYRLYHLFDESEAAALIADTAAVPRVRLGERAFEIVLARRIAAGGVGTEWFDRHSSRPITEIPSDWPESYQKVIEKRIDAIERRALSIGLIERPEFKRRWISEPWEKKEKEALRTWILDRCEERSLWFAPDGAGGEQPKPMTIFRLADQLGKDPDVVAVARLYGGDDAKLVNVIAEIVEPEHVPYLAQLRYKESGLVKRARWEQAWELQREEDRTGRTLGINVPNKYGSGDFLKVSYWRNRGKLDVPKERFVSYPLTSPDTDGSLLLGWGGWNHLEQAQALYTLIEERRFSDGWDRERLAPLVAGLAEVMPWAWQWHGERDAEGRIPAAGYAEYLEEQQRELKLTDEELTAWRPKATGRGRSARK